MSEEQNLRHTPVKHEREETQPYQPEGDSQNRPDEGPDATRPIASDGNPDRKTERVPPVAPENATWESTFDESGGTESNSVRER